MEPAASAGKDELRRILRERRRRIPGEAQLAAAVKLAQQVLWWLAEPPAGATDGVVAAYLSAPPEPGTQELLHALWTAGYDVVVPACEPQYQLSWVHWNPGTGRARSPLAPVWEPVGPRHPFADLDNVRLVVVPGLALDAEGNRLGQGGGYYDRFLAQLRTDQPTVPALGYLYDEEILPTGAFEATVLDMPLAGAFTPSGYRRAS